MEIDLNSIPENKAQDILKQYLKYDFETGEFSYRHDYNIRRVKGALACGFSNGYVRFRVFPNGRKKYMAHRLVWLYVTGKWPKDQIDHINHDRSDNRFFNLREVTQAEQVRNKSIPKNNLSGCMGVFYKKEFKKWEAYITFEKERKFLGYFENKECAIKARKQAEKELGFHENSGIEKPRLKTCRQKGVYFNKQNNKWIAAITTGKIKKHLGSFKTKEEALLARKEAEIKKEKDNHKNEN